MSDKVVPPSGEVSAVLNHDWAMLDKIKEIRIVRSERDEALGHLKNLLAVIHRDGGHYAEKHGLAKSTKAARWIWGGLITKAEQSFETLAQVAVLVEACTTTFPVEQGKPYRSCKNCKKHAVDAPIQHADWCSLSNLPAAAKEMAEKAREWDKALSWYDQCTKERKVLEAQLARLRDALEFYADPWSKIDPDDRVPDFYSELEFGETAQAALSPDQKPVDAESESK